MPIVPLLKDLALEAASIAIEKVVSLFQRKAATSRDEPPMPLTHQAVEHQRAQMTASIAASKAAEAERRKAITARPAARGKLPPEGGPHGN